MKCHPRLAKKEGEQNWLHLWKGKAPGAWYSRKTRAPGAKNHHDYNQLSALPKIVRAGGDLRFRPRPPNRAGNVLHVRGMRRADDAEL